MPVSSLKGLGFLRALTPDLRPELAAVVAARLKESDAVGIVVEMSGRGRGIAAGARSFDCVGCASLRS